ncbi:MAG: hypothetical protein GQ533_14390 [Methanosarcinaceae archaeon]|nr:hypothetical protein [Methanosarcinaceae archaeon]
MRWKISVFLIAAIMLCVTLTGVAAAQEIKCAWDPCGEKVVQNDTDAVYALSKDLMLIGYYDENSNNRFDEKDGLYIDGLVDWRSSRWETESGDVRLTDFCDEYQPNTKIVHGDSDAGKQLKPLPGRFWGQAVVGFIDVNNDFVYDLADPLYVDTDGSSSVTVNDVRLTEDDAGEAYTRVTRDDSYLGEDLLDPVTYRTTLVTPIFAMLGYIDSDCSTTWTCVDKLYLQQLTSHYCWRDNDAELDVFEADSFEDLGAVVESNRYMFFDPNSFVADCVVTIGDFRIYIPQTAIDEENWPECGTKVKQTDVDAVYALSQDFMLIGYYDENSNNRFDEKDGLYIDGLLDCWVSRWETESGDVRLTDFCDEYDPNTKIVHGDSDAGKQLKQLPGRFFGQAVVGFIDVNNDFVYDLGDPLYVDTDNSSSVTVNDVRLTENETGEAYTRVTRDDSYLGEDLLDPVTYRTTLVTPIFAMLGYIDSDCSTTWTCVDKLYLQQMTSMCMIWKDSDAALDVFEVTTLADLGVLAENNRDMFFNRCGFVADSVVTIGDFRIYIPPEAINEGWPKCGTKVELCDIDAVYALIRDFMLIGYYDENSNNRFDEKDGLYIDGLVDWWASRWETESGDVRFTDFCGEYEPNTKIVHGDNDAGKQLKPLPGRFWGQAVVGFVDVYNDFVYDLADPLYVDTDDSSSVTVNDVRLTENETGVAYTRVTRDDSYLGEDLLDPVTYRTTLVTPIFAMLGYIDSDCSTTWTCVDILYLQQITCHRCCCWIDSDEALDEFEVNSLEELGEVTEKNRHLFFPDCCFVADCVVTIGDFRAYVPPGMIDENSDDTQDVDTFDPMVYDTQNPFGVIEKDEVFNAIADYLFDGTITKDNVYAVIGKYLFG